MSHRKVHSHGSIPFSWEDKPGVCKTPSSSSSSSTSQPPPTPTLKDVLKIPLPPCPSHHPSRSTSGKGLRLQEDPFLVAYKEITKSDKSGKLLGDDKKKNKKKKNKKKKKKGVGSGSCVSVSKSRSIFSCKSSGDVRDGNLTKLSQLPRLPRDRSRTLTLAEELKRDFKYETWV